MSAKAMNLEAAQNMVALIDAKALTGPMLPTMARLVVQSNGNYANPEGKKFSPSLVALKELISNKSEAIKEYRECLTGFITWLDENVQERGTGTGGGAIVETFTVAGKEYQFSDFLDFGKSLAILQDQDAPKALASLFAGIDFENESQKVSVLYDAKVQVRRFVMQPLASVKSGRTRERKSASETSEASQ